MSIPTDEEFERAKEMMRADFRNLDRVQRTVLRRFADCIQRFHILPQGDVNFRAYVFFDTDQNLKSARKSGLTQQIEEAVIGELHDAGRGEDDLSVAFEFDSDQNVKANYEGDYFLRLR